MDVTLPTQVKCQGLAYPDGSGGPGWVPKQCAQAGSGLAVLVPEVGPEGVAGFASVAFGGAGVPGRQTVPRAELGAIKLAASLASPGQGLTVFPDATYTSRGLALDDRAARLAKLSKGTNGDLWTELVDTLTEQHLDVRANKVRAHARLSEVVAGSVAPEEFLGNLVADAAAGLAAQESTYANGPNLRRARQWDE